MAYVESEAQFSGDIAPDLLRWYDAHSRALPWRAPPGAPRPDPYRVWLSEIMLQQTTVAAVGPYFDRFTKRWPDVKSLASAEDAELMAAWAGLGYYARARNLLACARTVLSDHGGRFPETEAGLRSLPGIGVYTAAAIASIAFDVRAVVVDANVERVVARLFAIQTPLPAAKREIRAACDQITPDRRSGDFAQAMMDLGATLCTPRNPDCHSCPLSKRCSAQKTGIAETLPIKPAKTVKPQRAGTAYWIEKDDHVWLVQRPSKGMLAGMRALPDDGWMARHDGDQSAPFIGGLAATRRTRGTRLHPFFSLSLGVSVHAGTANEGALPTRPMVANKDTRQRGPAHPIHESGKGRAGAQGELKMQATQTKWHFMAKSPGLFCRWSGWALQAQPRFSPCRLGKGAAPISEVRKRSMAYRCKESGRDCRRRSAMVKNVRNILAAGTLALDQCDTSRSEFTFPLSIR